jgi:Zn-finger protein
MQGNPLKGTIENCYNCQAPLHVAHSTKRGFLLSEQNLVYCCNDCALAYSKIRPVKRVLLPSPSQFAEMIEHVESGKYTSRHN